MNHCLGSPCRFLLPGLALAVLGLAAVPALKSAAAAAPAPVATADGDLKAGHYVIDSVHSNVVFRILHMNVSPFWGRFNHVEGQFTLDPDKPEAATLEVKIQADSVDTNNGKRNSHVMSPDFLSVKEFPLIQFKSTKVNRAADGVYEVTGKLTLHGVSQDLMLHVEQTGAGEGAGQAIAGFESTFTIQRSKFGMDQMLDALGDDVRVTVGLEARLE